MAKFSGIAIVKNIISDVSGCWNTRYRIMLRMLFQGLGFIVLGLLFYGAYYWYTAQREQAAEKDYSAYLFQYQGALQSTDPMVWERAASLFEVGYAQHRSSSLAPYFLLLQAQALVQQKKNSEAQVVLRKILDVLPKKSPFYSHVELMYHLITLDLPDRDGLHEQSLTALEELGRDTSGAAFEAALFYAARYHFTHHNIEKARMLWQQLRATAIDEHSSSLAQKAEEYLEIIG